MDLTKSGTGDDPLRNMFEELGEHFEERLLTIGAKFIASEIPQPNEFTVDLGDLPIIHGENIIASTHMLSTQTYSLLVGLSPEELASWRAGYRADSHYAEVLESLQDPKSNIAPAFPQYFYLDEGLLYFEDSAGNSRLCIPKSIQLQVIDQVHNSLTESAHSGYQKCYNRLAATHYWPGMSRDLKKYIATCDICQKSKPRQHGPIGLLQPIPIPMRPFKVVSMDFIPELPSSLGYDNILVIVDKLTKYGIFIPCTMAISDDTTT